MEVRLLGPVEAAVGDRVAALGPPRQRAVLALLALSAPGIVSTDRFVDGLWGETPPRKPLPALQVFVHGLRKALRELVGADLVDRAAPGYLLRVTAEQVDVHVFVSLLQRAREQRAAGQLEAARASLVEALGLWRGPALADVRSAAFAVAEVSRLDELRLQAEEEAYDVRLGLGEHSALIEGLGSAVAAHPMRERFWGQLMVALYRCDRQADALTTYARARERLADELGLDPGQALQQLELAILRQDPTLAAPAPGAAPVAPRRSRRVPRPTTRTFGRAAMVAEVGTLLGLPEVRAVTLVGPGGSGKSRVAALAAAGVPDAVHLGVTERTDPDQLAREVALALTGTDDEEALDGVAEGALVVLDNLEALPDGAVVVTRLLERAAGVTVLATSRLPLRIRAEYVVAVPPLETPAPGAGPASIAQAPSVRMFVDRAGATSGFRLDGHATEVADLCRFLDGLPLAIELAAAQTSLLSPDRIRRSLEHDLGLLESRAVDVPVRQRTLAATIEWSCERLSPAARSVLDRLALFERSFTVEAVEAICEDVPDVLAAVAELVEARLIRLTESRVEIRFVVLGTVRSYARARLREQGDLDVRRDAHTRHLLLRVRRQADELDGPEGPAAVGRFDDTAADVDAAVDWAAASGRLTEAVGLVSAATDLWIASGRLTDQVRRAERLLDLAGLDPAARADLHVTAGKLAYHLTQWPRAAAHCRAALAVEEATTVTAAAARCHLGAALVVTGAVEEGTRLATEALEAGERDGLHAVTVVALSVLAISRAMAGDLAGERSFHERRLAVVTERGDVARLADTLNTLAEIALDEADGAMARDYATESIAIAGTAFPLEARDATITLARAAVVQGDAVEAASRLAAGLALADRTGQALAVAQCLRVGACLAVLEGRPAVAARAFAAAQTLSPSPSGTDEPMEGDLAEGLARARALLGESAFGREWTLGRTLPVASARGQIDRLVTARAGTPALSGG